jgi:hypothetical protein
VKLADWYDVQHKFLTHEEHKLLKRLEQTLFGRDRILMENILAKFALD